MCVNQIFRTNKRNYGKNNFFHTIASIFHFINSKHTAQDMFIFQHKQLIYIKICTFVNKNFQKMKYFFIAALICISSISCTTHFGNRKLADGWYHVENMENNIVKNRPIVKASDFTDMQIDSMRIDGSSQTIYTITGKCNDSEKFAEATEEAIGKHIAFLFDGKIVCAPKVNARIDSGNFMITFPAGTSHFDAVMVLEALRKQSEK